MLSPEIDALGFYFSTPNLQEIDAPAHETMRMPTLRSLTPQSKSLGRPLGPDPGEQAGGSGLPTCHPGAKVSVVWPV
jgi:hypothetical protein